MSRLGRTGVRLAGLGLGLLIGLALAEVVARALSVAPPLREVFDNYATDDRLPFKPKPFSRITGRNDEFEFDYQHNSFGFRDVEHALGEQDGSFRILGLGDSFTYGIGVRWDETYLSVLEVGLNRRPGAHPAVEVIKAGIPRFFPEAERILLEEYGVPFQPDLIVVGILPNDVVDTHLGLDAVTVDTSGFLRTRDAERFGALGRHLLGHSHLARVLLRAYVARRSRPREAELFRDGGPHEEDWSKMEGELGRMATLADSIGARLVVVHIPQKGPWRAESRYLPTRFSGWAAGLGVDFVDVLPAMEAVSDPEGLYHSRDGHCTAAGHAVIAAALQRHLTEQDLVP